MKNIIIISLMLVMLNACSTKATKYKMKVEDCKSIYEYFTKSLDCIGLNFQSFYSEENQEYEKQHDVLIAALADQIYSNKIDNDQGWKIYDEFLAGFRKAKNKSNFLTNSIYRTK